MDKLIDEEYLAAWRNFITAHAKLIEKIDEDLVSAGVISLQWYDILIELFEAENHRLRLHDLAGRVLLSRSSITRLVDLLEGEGLLRREPDPHDRRGAYAVLTIGGTEALREAWPVYARSIIEHFGQFLSAEEAQIMAAAFARMLEAQ